MMNWLTIEYTKEESKFKKNHKTLKTKCSYSYYRTLTKDISEEQKRQLEIPEKLRSDSKYNKIPITIRNLEPNRFKKHIRRYIKNPNYIPQARK